MATKRSALFIMNTWTTRKLGISWEVIADDRSYGTLFTHPEEAEAMATVLNALEKARTEYLNQCALSAVREPEYRHLYKVAVYDTLRIRYDHDEDCDNYDVTGYEDYKGNEWPEGQELLHSLMQAHKITMKEIIEDAPKTEDA